MKEFDWNLATKQDEAVECICRPESDGAALLAFDMGLGKTRIGLMVARAKGAKVVLVCVPQSTFDSWEETAAEEYPELRVRVIGSPLKRHRGAREGFEWRQPGIYLVSHEYFERHAWKKVPVIKRRKDEPDRTRKVDSGLWSGPGYLFIMDESHRSANITSWTHLALRNLDPSVFKLSMSGTFFGDKFGGAYGAAKWLWPHRVDILPDNIYDWRDMWALTEYDHFAPDKKKIKDEKSHGAFVSALPCYLREESQEPPAIEHVVWSHLHPEQRRVYDELDDRMVAWVKEHPLVTEIGIVKRARQRQATLAMFAFDFDEETGDVAEVYYEDDAESSKIDDLILAIEGKNPQLDPIDLLVGQQLVIGTDSQKFARLLTKRLNLVYGENAAREWSGPITKPQRRKNKAAFIAGEIRFLVGVQAAMGTGTDGLQAASHIAVIMSSSDRRINNDQFIARVRRKGQKYQTHAVWFLGVDTIDSGQLSDQMQAALRANASMRKKLREEAKREQQRTTG